MGWSLDGAPEFKTNTWYAIDVPIVISYHSFYSSSSSTGQTEAEVADAADIRYEAIGADVTWCCLISPSSSSVYYYYKDTSSVPFVLVGHITSGSRESGYHAHFDYDEGWDDTITITDSGITVIRSDGSYGAYTTPISLEDFQEQYQKNALTIPEGFDFEALSASNADDAASSSGASSASQSTASSKPDFTKAYSIHFKDYAIYYLFDFVSGEVRCFNYGDGSEYAYVGHITEGSWSKGCTVHYDYDGGWDEKMTFTGGTMTSTGADGYKTEFSSAPLNAVKSIYKTYHDM